MAISTYSRYLKSTGQILSVFTCADAVAADQIDFATQGAWVGELDPDTERVDYDAGPPIVVSVVARPASSAAYSGNATLVNDGADTGTITPIGAAAVVTIVGTSLSGKEFSLTTFDPWGADDTLEFTSTIEADYTVTIEDFPDQTAVFVIPVRA